MANALLNDAYAFKPNGGGRGVRLNVTATASVPVGVPMTGDASDPALVVRVRLVNTGSENACVALQGTADRNCMVLVPGIPEMFTVPFSPQGVTISAITEELAVSTAISVVAGDGY